MPLRISKRELVTSDLRFRKVAVVSSAEDTDWWQEEADIGEGRPFEEFQAKCDRGSVYILGVCKISQVGRKY